MRGPSQSGSLGRRLTLGAITLGAMLLGQRTASADPPAAKAADAPKAEVMVVHATKCEKKSVDPALGDAPPALGYDCLQLIEKKVLPLAPNKASTTPLPNGRTFELLYGGKVGDRFKVTASIDRQAKDAGAAQDAFKKLADITAEANKPFNVGGFSYKGGVLVLTVRIVP